MGFKKVLSYKVILLITVNSIIGSGMFFLPAIGAKLAGPSSILSWLILSVMAILTAMIFAEMVSMYPKAGGIYEFCKNAYGSFASFIIGWIAWIVGNVTTAMLIVGAIQYLLPYDSPYYTAFKIAVCLFWVGVFNIMAYRGMKTSAFMLVTFAIITISIIVSLIVPGLFYADISNLQPFFIHEGFINISMIFLTIFFISEAFFGLESVMFLAEETKNPRRDLPRALVHGTVIIAILTMLLVTISLSVIGSRAFGISDAPFALMAHHMLGPMFGNIVVLGTYLVIIGAAAGWVVTGPRLIVSLTRDRMFPPKFGALHPVYDSPYNAIKFQAIVTSILVLVGFFGEGYETLLSMLVPLVLIMMSASIFALVILRRKKPDLERPYKAPFGMLGAALLVLFNIALVVTWIFQEIEAIGVILLVLSIVLIGIPIYLFLQLQYNPRSMHRINEIFSYLALHAEPLILPSKVKKEIVRLLGDLKGKKVFELGCYTGSLTMRLAEEVGPYGKVYATDGSKLSIDITKGRSMKERYNHVSVTYDKDHLSRVHPDIPKVDCAAAVDSLGYLVDIDNILFEINKRLETGGNICFVEFDKFFYLISNINWLSNDSLIKHIFRRNGFLVNVERKKGLWQTVYIYGTKVMDAKQTPKTEKLDIDDIFDNRKRIDDLYSYVKGHVMEYKDPIMKKEIGLVVYHDKRLKDRLEVNTFYFDRIFDKLLEVIVHFAINKIIVIIEKRDGDLRIKTLGGISPDDLRMLMDPSEGYDIRKERLDELHYLRRLVSLGYKGDIDLRQVDSLHDPDKYSDFSQLFLGLYEEEKIRPGEDYLQIVIDIPLENIIE